MREVCSVLSGDSFILKEGAASELSLNRIKRRILANDLVKRKGGLNDQQVADDKLELMADGPRLSGFELPGRARKHAKRRPHEKTNQGERNKDIGPT